MSGAALSPEPPLPPHKLGLAVLRVESSAGELPFPQIRCALRIFDPQLLSREPLSGMLSSPASRPDGMEHLEEIPMAFDGRPVRCLYAKFACRGGNPAPVSRAASDFELLLGGARPGAPLRLSPSFSLAPQAPSPWGPPAPPAQGADRGGELRASFARLVASRPGLDLAFRSASERADLDEAAGGSCRARSSTQRI